MIINKAEIAKKYYNGLLELKNSESEISKELYKKVKKIGKERFIREYPLSTLEIVSYRTFWELLIELSIVKRPFHCDYKEYNDFEYNLRTIIDDVINKNNKKHNNEDIIGLFKKHKISA